jgi:hypothetical protein
MGHNPSEAAQLCIRIETDEKEVQDTSCRGSGEHKAGDMLSKFLDCPT